MTEKAQNYRDVSWLMPHIDVEQALAKLDARICGRNGNRVLSYCPDHHLFTGRKPSHPKWLLNEDTGATFCLTEGRGSNILWTVVRLLDAEPEHAIRFLVGRDNVTEQQLRLSNVQRSQERIRGSRMANEEKDIKEPEWKREVEASLKNRATSKRLLEFFIRPPGKNPTNILPETVERYKVFDRTWGYYANRAVIPFFMSGEVVGFCAVDLLGKADWLVSHPGRGEGDYKKTLYPPGFKAATCLFGYDDCEKGADVLVVAEGAREVMKLTQEGFKNAVAVLGSSLSSGQLSLIAKLAPKRVALMFDGDDAGYATTDRIAKKMEPLWGKSGVLQCIVPRGKDPKNLDREELEGLLKKRIA